MTNEKNCPLADHCRMAGDIRMCTKECLPYISVMARYKSANIPLDYQNIFLDNSPAKEDQADIYGVLDSYVKSFSEDGMRIKSLYLFSTSPGTGKTTTATALLNEYIERRFMYYVKKEQAPPRIVGMFLDINDLQMRYNLAAMTGNTPELETIKQEIKRATTVEFAVLDDIGVRKDATDSFRSLVHSIINSRLTNHRPTIYTSNLPMSDMRKVFDDRLGDRIADMTAEFTFKGTSKRGVR